MESQIESSWSEENSLQLIAEYRAREILWNPKNENFYKKHFKQDAWNEIAQLMSMTNEKCNSKIVSLLSSYRREKLRERKSVTRGKDPADRYKSRWFAYNALKFLDDRNKPRKRRIMEILQNPSPEKTNNTEPSAMQLTPQLQTRRNITIMSTNSIGTIHTANKTGNTENSQALTKSFSTFIGAKMSTYSDQTRTSVEHAIFEILMKADRGYFELPWRQRCDQQEDI
ncbi:unnamed protein product [Leptosia nina]|uniref:MADF domain-containing protein n=1 Tax=Leptosia nina TaxID=320188 RepID=A0AAV1IZI0_9NEOP